MRSTRSPSLVALLALGLVTAGCGDSNEPVVTTAATVEAVESTTTTGTSESTAPSTTADSATAASLREMQDELGIETIPLHSTDEGGPHPTLSWDAVEGAASYWVVLHDSGGQVYWAWTGSDTSVRIGGGDRPELNQTAALHEPMTWAVTAVDEVGNLVALSEVASISP